jgi:hypothetical protein
MASIRLSIVIVVCCAASVSWVPTAASQTAGGAKAATPRAVPKTGATLKTVPMTGDGAAPKSGKSLSDSPYQNGAPPITGGFTDTSQGGKKTSGDPLAVPPGVGRAPTETGK